MKLLTNTCPGCEGNYEFPQQEVGRECCCPHCGLLVTLQPNRAERRTKSANSELRVVLRWLAVLPAALAAYVAVAGAVGTLWHFLGGGWSLEVVGSGATSAAFVYAGAVTAPACRVGTAIGLAIFQLGLLVFCLVVVVGSQQASYPLWWLITCFVVSVVSTVYACVQIREREEHPRRYVPPRG
jgi:hypothetical protein